MKAPPAAPRPRMSASAPATPATTRAPTPAPHAAPACEGKKQRVEVAQEQEGEAMEAQDLGSEAMQAIDAFLETNAKEADASKEVVCRMMAEDAVQFLSGGLEPYLKTTKAKRMPCETVCADFGLYKCDVTVLKGSRLAELRGPELGWAILELHEEWDSNKWCAMCLPPVRAKKRR